MWKLVFYFFLRALRETLVFYIYPTLIILALYEWFFSRASWRTRDIHMQIQEALKPKKLGRKNSQTSKIGNSEPPNLPTNHAGIPKKGTAALHFASSLANSLEL